MKKFGSKLHYSTAYLEQNQPSVFITFPTKEKWLKHASNQGFLEFFTCTKKKDMVNYKYNNIAKNSKIKSKKATAANSHFWWEPDGKSENPLEA